MRIEELNKSFVENVGNVNFDTVTNRIEHLDSIIKRIRLRYNTDYMACYFTIYCKTQN